MKDSVIKVQLALRLRAFKDQVLEHLHRRMIGIAIVVLLLVSPTGLAAYYQLWTAHDVNPLFLAASVPGIFGVSLLLFSDLEPGRRQIEVLLLSLPISRASRLIYRWIEALLVQAPALLISLFAALNELWFRRPLPNPAISARIFFGTLAVLCFNGAVRAFSPAFRFRFPEPGVRLLRHGARPLASFDSLPALTSGGLKLRIHLRTHFRKSTLTLAIFMVVSWLGWKVALVPNPDQPKATLYLILSGLLVLTGSWLLQGLRIQDSSISDLLKTLPRNDRWHERSIQASFGLFLLPALMQSLIWNAVSISWSMAWISLGSNGVMVLFVLNSHRYPAKWHTFGGLGFLGILATLQTILTGVR